MKPVVHYTQVVDQDLKVGKSTRVFGVRDHPYISPMAKYVVTSPIIRVEEDGTFETLNTIYKPELFFIGAIP